MAIKSASDTIELLIKAKTDFSDLEKAHKKSGQQLKDHEKSVKQLERAEKELIKSKSVSYKAEIAAGKASIENTKRLVLLEDRRRQSLLGQMKSASKLLNYNKQQYATKLAASKIQVNKEAAYMAPGKYDHLQSAGQSTAGNSAIREYYAEIEAAQARQVSAQAEELSRLNKLELQYGQYVVKVREANSTSYHAKQVAHIAASNNELARMISHYKTIERVEKNIATTKAGRIGITPDEATAQKARRDWSKESLADLKEYLLEKDKESRRLNKLEQQYKQYQNVLKSGGSTYHEKQVAKIAASNQELAIMISKYKTLERVEQNIARTKSNNYKQPSRDTRTGYIPEAEENNSKEQLALLREQYSAEEKVSKAAERRLKLIKNIDNATQMIIRTTTNENRVKNLSVLIGLRKQAVLQKNTALIRTLSAEINKQTAIIESNTKAEIKNEKAKKKKAATLASKDDGGFMGAFESKGSSFGHKVGTTAQYALAGSGIYAVAQAARAGLTAVIDFDTAVRTMSAVLGETTKTTTELGQELNDLGKQFGGTQKEIYDIAMALGRAGVATDELTEATEVAMKMAMLTGDTFAESTKSIISYNTVFGKDGMGNVVYTVEELGDKLAFVANASRLSTQDIGTFSNYALAAAKTVGLTIDAVGAMAASFNNAGLSASTTGTQIRSFTRILTDQSKGVKKLFQEMGLTQKVLLSDIQKGGEEGNRALTEFGRKLKDLSDEDFAEFTDGLDIRARASLSTMKQQFGEFHRLLKKSVNDSGGELKKTSVIVEGFATTWEGTMNSMKDATIDTLNPALQTSLEYFASFGDGIDVIALKIQHLRAMQADKSVTPSGNILVDAYKIMKTAFGADDEEQQANNEREKNILTLRQGIRLLSLEYQTATEARKVGILTEIDGFNVALKYNKAQHKFIGNQLRIKQLQEEINTVAKIYTDAVDSGDTSKADHAKDSLIRMNKEYSKLVKNKEKAAAVVVEKTTPYEPTADLNLLQKSVVIGSKAHQEMEGTQAILEKLGQSQIDDQQEYIKLQTERNGLVNGEGEAILKIAQQSDNQQQTTKAIADLQVLSLTTSRRGGKIIETVTEYLEKQLGIQQTIQKGKQSINQENLFQYNAEVKALKQNAKTTEAEQDVRLGKISQIKLANIQLENQKQLLEDIKAKTVTPGDKVTGDQKTADISTVEADIAKRTADLAVKQQAQRVKLDQQYYKAREELAYSSTAKMFGYEAEQHFEWGEWFILFEGKVEKTSADIKTSIYHENYLKERARLHKAAMEGEITAEQEAEYIKAQNALLAKKADDSQKAAFTSPMASEFEAADNKDALRREAADEQKTLELATADQSYIEQIALLDQFNATKEEYAQAAADRMVAITKAEDDQKRAYTVSSSMLAADQTASVAGSLANTMDNLQKAGLLKSKKAAKAMQAMQIIQATASTYTSAVEAFKSMAGIPYVGPALGAVAAAAAIAAGMANVAQIKAQTFHTGGTVGPNGQKLRSDEIPAILQTGERVLSRQEVAQTQQAPTSNETVIINSIDPAVIESYMTSRSGRKVIQNVVNA